MIMSIVTVAMYGMKMVFGNVAMNVVKESGSGMRSVHSFTKVSIYLKFEYIVFVPWFS